MDKSGPIISLAQEEGAKDRWVGCRGFREVSDAHREPARIVLGLHLLWGCSVLQPSPLHPAWAQKLLMEYVNCVHAPHNRLRHLDCPQRTTFASHTRRGSGTRIFLHTPPFLSEHSLMQEELDSSQAVRIKPGDSFPG